MCDIWSLPTGHHLAADHQDVGGLQHRVVEQAERGALELQVAHLLLERRDALARGSWRDEHREQQEQLRDLGDQRLQVERALVRVDADGQEVEHALADVVADVVRRARVAGGQRVVVGDQEEAVVLAAVLQLEVFFERADVVAEVELARSAAARSAAACGVGTAPFVRCVGHGLGSSV